MTARSLEGKVALITGASSGLGRAFALELARAGVRPFLVARREEELHGVVEEISAAGGDAAYHVADVRVTPSLFDLVDVLLARFKRLDVLINNAGVCCRAPLRDLKRGEIQEMLETNLSGPIFLCQAALPALLRSSPSDIVNVSSTAGLEGVAEGTAYCGAKAGLLGFSRALAVELAPANVRVTAICTASTETIPDRLEVDDAVRAVMNVLTSPPDVLYGEIVLRPRAV